MHHQRNHAPPGAQRPTPSPDEPERAASSQRVRELLHRHALLAESLRNGIGASLALDAMQVRALIHLSRGICLTPAQLGERLGLTSGGVTALRQRMELRKLVRRLPHPRDRRSVLLQPTQHIVDELRDAYLPLVNSLDAAADSLSANQRAAVAGFLEEAVVLTELAVTRELHGMTPLAEPDPVNEPGLWA